MSSRTDTPSVAPTKVARWAALPTLLMALMNVGAALPAEETDTPVGVNVACAVVGLAGLIAGIALLRRVGWAVAAVVAVGVLNLIGAVVALIAGWEGAPVGLVLSVAALVLIGVGSNSRSAA